MHKLYKLLSILVIPSVLLLYSNAGGSPGGKTASIGDGGISCTDCHNGTAQQQPGWITTNIPSDGYTAGENYTITATGTHAGVVKFGFELTSENNMGGKLGGFTITDMNRTQFTNINNAVTHTQAGNVPSGNTNSWSMDWTAPDGVDGAVFFYAAFNAANGNGNTSGDQIYTTSVSVSEYIPIPLIVAVEPDRGEQGSEGMVTISGENTSWNSGVFSVQFRNHLDGSVKFTASNIQVKSDTELTCDILIPSDQEIGTYDVSVDALSIPEGFTVDITSGLTVRDADDLISLYPNPSSDFLNIKVPEGADVRIIDMSGHEMFRMGNVNGQQRIDISGFKVGIYIMHITYNGTHLSRRLLKN